MGVMVMSWLMKYLYSLNIYGTKNGAAKFVWKAENWFIYSWDCISIMHYLYYQSLEWLSWRLSTTILFNLSVARNTSGMKMGATFLMYENEMKWSCAIIVVIRIYVF